jgi:hypothetical protein
VAVIAGPVGSGRTSVACGIGTEFAFGHASVRYLSFDDLIEFAATSDFETDPPLPGPANIGFWPWSRAQVLIIDNVGPIIAASDMVHKAGRDGALSAWLADRLPNIREALRSRHTIWILGEIGSGSADQLQRSADEIGRFLGVADPLAILMQPSRTAQPQPVTWVQRALRFLAGLAGQRFPSPAVAAPVGPRPVRRDSD